MNTQNNLDTILNLYYRIYNNTEYVKFMKGHLLTYTKKDLYEICNIIKGDGKYFLVNSYDKKHKLIMNIITNIHILL